MEFKLESFSQHWLLRKVLICFKLNFFQSLQFYGSLEKKCIGHFHMVAIVNLQVVVHYIGDCVHNE